MKSAVWHIAALVTVSIWGTTFVSTKVLLAAGLTPSGIFAIRFLLAYAGIWFFPDRGGRHLFSRSVTDELLFAALGITGGSLYFIAENEALLYSQASNVAFIVCTTPVLTMLMMFLLRRGERLTPLMAAGTLLSLLGVGLVVFNGCKVLRLNPAGDLLALAAAILWALYTLILQRLDARYSVTMITRKTFFYGLLTLLPLLAFRRPDIDLGLLARPDVILNLLYLGIVASLLCYAAWSLIVKHLGSTRTTNYLYVNPVVATVTSAAILGERITPLAIAGALMILAGIYMVERPQRL
ncbi:MAG: DMT family transporter [Alistipes sp.]|nr:DMT family transporter [Alistipes sp.]